MVNRRDLSTFRRKLLAWFHEYRRDLPWRRTKDPYRIWLSEIMLQQTRVAAVIPYYERFLEHFPDVKALATAPEEKVLRIWSGLGYYSRARNLQRAAQETVAKYDGAFPRKHEQVLALPGIGEYTAAAILSIAFGEKHAVVDGNVARVIARLMALKGGLRENGRWRLLQETAKGLLHAKSPGDWNQAMMELGATICTPRSPQCLVCPVARFCRARKMGMAELVPAKYQKPTIVEVTLAAGVLIDARWRCALVAPARRIGNKRATDDIATLVSGMWHFPMVSAQQNGAWKLRNYVSAIVAAKGGKRQPLSLEALPKVRHTVTFRRITVLPFRIQVATLPSSKDSKIVPLTDVCSASSLAVSNLTRKIAQAANTGNACRLPAQKCAQPEAMLFADEPTP